MISIPENIENLKSYKPGKPISEIVRDYGLEKTAVLWNNENNLGASPKALAAVEASMKESFLYPDPACILLRTRIAEGVGRSMDEVIVGNGSESVFNYILNAFFEDDEELLTSEGTFVAIYIWAKANNVPLSLVPLTKDYGYDLEGILNQIGPKTKAIYLSNPNNPTGAMISYEELDGFMQKVPKNILVIVDEAYCEYARDLASDYPDSTRMNYDNLITLRTFSKAYGIAAIRIGYGIGPTSLIEPLMKVKLTFEPSNLAQAAGVGALEDTEFLDRTVRSNSDGMRYFTEEFGKLGLKYIPSYGNFMMIDLENAERVQDTFQSLMKKGVFVRPLPAFGLPHCLRITIGTQEENEMCVAALKEIFS